MVERIGVEGRREGVRVLFILERLMPDIYCMCCRLLVGKLSVGGKARDLINPFSTALTAVHVPKIPHYNSKCFASKTGVRR